MSNTFSSPLKVSSPTGQPLALVAEDEILVLMDIEDTLARAGITNTVAFATGSLVLK